MLKGKNALVTGSTSGTSLLTKPQYGSVELNFAASPDSLKLAFPNVCFESDMPNADPKGGAEQSELVGTAYRTGATSPVTAGRVFASSASAFSALFRSSAANRFVDET